MASNHSHELLVVASLERVDSKASLWKTRKTSKDQREIISGALQNGYSEKIEISKENVETSLKKLYSVI